MLNPSQGPAMRPQSQKSVLTVLALAALVLAGCEPTAPEDVLATNWESAPRDVLSTESRTATLTLSSERGTLSASERKRLFAWLAGFGHGRPGSIHALIRGPGSREQLHRIAMEMIAVGVEPQKIELVPGQPGPWRRAGVTITASRAIAILPDCPGWISHVAAPEDNAIEPGMGCSDTSNLAAMIRDPAELASGESSPYHDGEVGALAVTRYRTDKVKPLPTRNALSVIGGTGSGGAPQENSQGNTPQ
jgi:pilus assembly protein CpaD